MPIQVYQCPVHGEFERFVLFSEEVKREVPCPGCERPARHVISAPGAVIVEGGTGAGRERR